MFLICRFSIRPKYLIKFGQIKLEVMRLQNHLELRMVLWTLGIQRSVSIHKKFYYYDQWLSVWLSARLLLISKYQGIKYILH